MIIFNQKSMNSMERKCLEKIDELVLNASTHELEKIQEIDYQTQLEGLSFYDVYLDSSSLIHQSMKKPFRQS